jgi:membrane protein YdbS with pleckstrin-like domain
VRVGSVATVIVVIWLLIGVIATAQRGYFSGSNTNCAKTGTIVVTVLAGPLNYIGVNPKVNCQLPQPSP